MKGKSYQFGVSHLGVVSNLPGLLFNPARVFSLYLDKVALLHSNSDSSSDLLFPSCKYSGKVQHTLDKPVSYNVLLKQFKLSVVEAKIDVGLSKVGLHCMRRGGGRGHPCCESWGTPLHCPEVYARQIWGNGWVLCYSQRRRLGESHQVGILIIFLLKFYLLILFLFYHQRKKKNNLKNRPPLASTFVVFSFVLIIVIKLFITVKYVFAGLHI